MAKHQLNTSSHTTIDGGYPNCLLGSVLTLYVIGCNKQSWREQSCNLLQWDYFQFSSELYYLSLPKAELTDLLWQLQSHHSSFLRTSFLVACSVTIRPHTYKLQNSELYIAKQLNLLQDPLSACQHFNKFFPPDRCIIDNRQKIEMKIQIIRPYSR